MIFPIRILITSTMGHCKYGREYPSTIFASVLFLFSAFIQFMILSMRIFLAITMRQGKKKGHSTTFFLIHSVGLW